MIPKVRRRGEDEVLWVRASAESHATSSKGSRSLRQLAADYFRMVELFEPESGPVPPDSLEGERRQWVELFRAALLRKVHRPG